MGAIALFLEFYFAAMLSISGLAKTDQPERFALTLYRHGILPRRTVPAISRLLPWAELVLAVWLVSGVAVVGAIIGALGLFAVFGTVELILVLTNRATECGCFGVAYPQRVDRASVAVSAILVLAAGVNLWIVEHSAPVNWHWHAGGTALFVVCVGWLGVTLFAYRRSWRRHGNPVVLTIPPAG